MYMHNTLHMYIFIYISFILCTCLILMFIQLNIDQFDIQRRKERTVRYLMKLYMDEIYLNAKKVLCYDHF